MGDVGEAKGSGHLNTISVHLDERALLDLQQVLLDDDAEAALQFVKKHVAPKVPKKGTAACDSTRLNPFIRK
ncbi:MAG: hypothetical protein OEV33_01720 [Armatimonadota bacterium]|nr:hypothetical protein [Armatimonadota bacterium]